MALFITRATSVILIVLSTENAKGSTFTTAPEALIAELPIRRINGKPTQTSSLPLCKCKYANTRAIASSEGSTLLPCACSQSPPRRLMCCLTTPKRALSVPPVVKEGGAGNDLPASFQKYRALSYCSDSIN